MPSFASALPSAAVKCSLLLLTVMSGAVAEGQSPNELPCRTHAGLQWKIVGNDSRRVKSDEWCLTVGPAAIAPIDSVGTEIHKIALVSWNVHVGGGSVEDLVAYVRALNSFGPDVGIILLLQEAFRAGENVPLQYPSHIKVPAAIRPRRPAPDLMESARQLSMSAIYIPSMRNGPSKPLLDGTTLREDRGNAILSTEPLSDFQAIELPLANSAASP